MATFKRVNKAPENLKEGECVIVKPDFKEQIQATSKRRDKTGLITVSNLRDIFMAITDKYDNTVNPYNMKLSKYRGIPFGNDDELSKIVFKVISDHDLDLLDKALEHEIKNRPVNTEVIYYVSDDLVGNGAFIRNGINQADVDLKKTKTKSKEQVEQ